MHSSYPLSLALLFSPLVLAGSSVTCWFPDGQTSTVDHVACDDSAGNNLENGAACCQNGTNDYCLGNGLCSRYGTVYRGSCTDKTWRSPACSQMCLDEREYHNLISFYTYVSTVVFCSLIVDSQNQSFLRLPLALQRRRHLSMF